MRIRIFFFLLCSIDIFSPFLLSSDLKQPSYKIVYKHDVSYSDYAKSYHFIVVIPPNTDCQYLVDTARDIIKDRNLDSCNILFFNSENAANLHISLKTHLKGSFMSAIPLVSLKPKISKIYFPHLVGYVYYLSNNKSDFRFFPKGLDSKAMPFEEVSSWVNLGPR